MTELRQRKPDVTKEGEAKNPSVGDTAERYVDAARTMAPELLQPYIKAMVPLARIIAEGVQASIPFLVEIHSMLLKLWAALKPYKPELLYPAFFGIVLCFFGGSFVTLIAAAEAYNMCSHETIMKCIHDLSVEFDAFLVHNKNDDKIDADGNGIADVAEATANQLAVRKCALFIKTVDPKRITEALAGLNSGALAIVATLKLEFAKSITLGNSISTMVFEGPAKTYVVPALEVTMPPDYKKWAAPLVQYSVKSAAISLAWFIQRVISAVHAALRGSKMCAENLLDYLTTMGFLSSVLRADLRLDLIIAPVLAAAGIWFQFSRAFTLPFPLNWLMMPFSVLEYLLMWAVSN